MKRNNNAFGQVLVGIFMVTILLLLGYFTIVISGVDIVYGRKLAKLTVTFEQVGGLKDHDNVMYRGTKVGTVERVAVTPSNLVVTAHINADVVLRTGYRIMVCNLSMLGGNYLMLDEGEGEPQDLEKTVFAGEKPSDWMADMARITNNLRKLTERNEIDQIITNLEAASASVREITGRIERGEGLVGKIVTGNDRLYEDIRTTAANARDISEQLNRKKLYDDLEAAIVDFRKVCANFEKSSRDVDLKGPLAKADKLMENFNAMAENLNTVAERLRHGEGTLGRLTADDGMYREVEGLIKDVRQVIDNYRDTTPISTFSSLAIGAF